MKISQVRARLRFFARNAKSSSEYTDAHIDFAAKAVCNDFIDYTKCTRTTSALTFVADVSTLALTTPVAAGFEPHRALRFWITTVGSVGRVDIIDHDQLVGLQIRGSGGGIPTKIAFPNLISLEAHPTPTSALTANLQWFEPFTTWTDGQALAATATAVLDELAHVASVSVTAPGGRYATAPTVSFSGGGGTGAAATAAIDFNGQVTGVTVTNVGVGYTSAPTVAFSGGGNTDSTVNLSDPILMKILAFGGPAFLQSNDPKHGFASKQYEQYLRCRRITTSGTGEQSVERAMLPEGSVSLNDNPYRLYE